MLNSTRAYIALSVIVASAGVVAYFYICRSAIEQSIPLGAAAPSAATPSASRNEDAERKIFHGVGSIKDLKPVPLQPALQP